MVKHSDEIEELQDDEDEFENEPINFEITTYPDDMRLESYKSQWDRKKFKIPEFQRNYVWDIKKASKLIESFLLGLPVPPVFLYKEGNDTTYHIMDGLQRITSVVSFLNEKFEDGKKFSLKGVRDNWNNKTFSELSSNEQERLQFSVMRAMIIKQDNPNDHTSIYQIFERLNTGGTSLNNMEVLMCIADGYFTKLLKEINDNPDWRKLIPPSDKYEKNIEDIQYLLRVFAFSENGDNYKAPMKKFLREYIESQKEISEDEVIKKEEYIKFFLKNLSHLEKPFYNKGNDGKFNAALMDAVVYALSKMDDNQITHLKERYNELMQNEKFLSNISAKNVNDKKLVQERLNLAKEIFVK